MISLNDFKSFDHRLAQPVGADSIFARNWTDMESAPTYHGRDDDQCSDFISTPSRLQKNI